MNTKTVTRKKRTDRTHIIYMIESGTDFYIGVTAKTMSTVKKSVLVRCNKHIYRMRSEDKSWMLYETMRERGTDSFTVLVPAKELYASSQTAAPLITALHQLNSSLTSKLCRTL